MLLGHKDIYDNRTIKQNVVETVNEERAHALAGIVIFCNACYRHSAYESQKKAFYYLYLQISL